MCEGIRAGPSFEKRQVAGKKRLDVADKAVHPRWIAEAGVTVRETEMA